MSNNKVYRVNFFTFIDILIKYKYALILSLLPPIIIYFFLQTKDATNEYKYILTVYPKDNPTSEQVVRSLENISKDNDILKIAEDTSILIYEDIVENSFRNSMLLSSKKSQDFSPIKEDELIYSINNILEGEKGFKANDKEPYLSDEIKKLINSFQTQNLFNSFTHRIDSESFVNEILDREENYQNSYFIVDPIQGEKDYLKEYNLITDIELDDELINLIISEISKQVYNEAFLRVESIANILQNKIDLKIEFLTQIKDSLVVKYVERANMDNAIVRNQKMISEYNNQLDKMQFEKDLYEKKLLWELKDYEKKMVYLQSHLEIAEDQNIHSYSDVYKNQIKNLTDTGIIDKDNFGITYNVARGDVEESDNYFSEKFNMDSNDNMKIRSHDKNKIFTKIESLTYMSDNYYLRGSDFIKNKIIKIKRLHELEKKILLEANNFQNKINMNKLSQLEKNLSIVEKKDVVEGEFDYYLTHFGMNIDLLKDLNFKNKIKTVLKESNIDDNLNLIAYYNYIKVFQRGSDNVTQILIATFVFSFISLYIIFFISNLYFLYKKENELN